MSQPKGGCAAVIVGAGRGTRFGASDKVLVPLNGRPLLAYSLDAAQASSLVEQIVVVVGEHIVEPVTALLASGRWTKIAGTVLGGDRRQDSVAAGLTLLADHLSYVAIHDAARPLVTPKQFDEALSMAQTRGVAIVATPVADTLKRVEEGLIVETVPREHFWAAQTPQACRIADLAQALAWANTEQRTVTDEASLFEALGQAVAIVEGSPANLKITRPADIAVASALLAARTTS